MKNNLYKIVFICILLLLNNVYAYTFKNENGNISCYDNNGTKIYNQLIIEPEEHGDEFYIDENGNVATGWWQFEDENGNKYYRWFKETGDEYDPIGRQMFNSNENGSLKNCLDGYFILPRGKRKNPLDPQKINLRFIKDFVLDLDNTSSDAIMSIRKSEKIVTGYSKTMLDVAIESGCPYPDYLVNFVTSYYDTWDAGMDAGFYGGMGTRIQAANMFDEFVNFFYAKGYNNDQIRNWLDPVKNYRDNKSNYVTTTNVIDKYLLVFETFGYSFIIDIKDYAYEDPNIISNNLINGLVNKEVLFTLYNESENQENRLIKNEVDNMALVFAKKFDKNGFK